MYIYMDIPVYSGEYCPMSLVYSEYTVIEWFKASNLYTQLVVTAYTITHKHTNRYYYENGINTENYMIDLHFSVK